MADDMNDRPDEGGNVPGDGHSSGHEGATRETFDRVVEKVQELAPVVGAKLHDGAVVVAKKVQEMAPVVGEKVVHGARSVAHAVQEATPVVAKEVTEGVHKAGEVFEDLKQQWAGRAQGSKDSAGGDEHTPDHDGSSGQSDEPA